MHGSVELDDEYSDGYGEEEEEEDDEQEEEDEPPQQPTQEEFEYLQLRQRLKEAIRKRKGDGLSRAGGQTKKPRLSNEKFGSFFGPSQPIIAKRVIEESKSFLETRHLHLKAPNPYHSNVNPGSNAATPPDIPKQGDKQQPQTVDKKKRKIQLARDARDYSFLFSDDADLPVSSQNQTAPKSSPQGSRPAHVGAKSRQERHMVSMQRPDVRKSGSAGQSGNARVINGQNRGMKNPPSKPPETIAERNVKTPLKNGVKKDHLQPQKPGGAVPRQPPPPKPAVRQEKDVRKKKAVQHRYTDDEDETAKAFSMLRRMSGYDPKRYNTNDDDDDSDMEANFDDIMMEERKSEKIARMEDEEELKKIQEEERRERMRKLEKQRRMTR